MPPAEVSRLAVAHGTVGMVVDPHEIANVAGMAGIEFMMENSRATPFHFYFGALHVLPVRTMPSASWIVMTLTVC
jgi:adenine deaminase